MLDICTITISGNLGFNSEIKQTKNGTRMLAFSVACSQGNNEAPIWFSCSLFGARADSLVPYLKKGTHVVVTGKFSTYKYKDSDGTSKVSNNIMVHDISLTPTKGGYDNQQPQQQRQPQPQAVNHVKPNYQPSQPEMWTENTDLPFDI